MESPCEAWLKVINRRLEEEVGQNLPGGSSLMTSTWSISSPWQGWRAHRDIRRTYAPQRSFKGSLDKCQAHLLKRISRNKKRIQEYTTKKTANRKVLQAIVCSHMQNVDPTLRIWGDPTTKEIEVVPRRIYSMLGTIITKKTTCPNVILAWTAAISNLVNSPPQMLLTRRVTGLHQF